jgi:hypothetical protein
MDVQEFAKVIGKEYYVSVETLLIGMAIGQTLCVHATHYTFGENGKFSAEQMMHTLNDGAACPDSGTIETQYGPKTYDMQQEIECARVGGAPWESADKAPSTTSATAVEAATASASPHSDCKCTCYIGCGTGPWQFCKDHGDRHRS